VTGASIVGPWEVLDTDAMKTITPPARFKMSDSPTKMSDSPTTIRPTSEGWIDVRQAATAQVAADPKWPIERFDAPLQAIQRQLLPGEQVLDIRTLHQGGPGKAIGAMVLTAQRLLVADLSRSAQPVAETVLFSEVKRVSARRRPFGVQLTVSTKRGRRYRAIAGKDTDGAKRFVAALEAQMHTQSAGQLTAVPAGAVAAQPPTLLARVQRAVELLEMAVIPVFPVAAAFVITGTTSNKLTQLVVSILAVLRVSIVAIGSIVVRMRGGSVAADSATEPVGLIPS
jgi:hypothetical protein